MELRQPLPVGSHRQVKDMADPDTHVPGATTQLTGNAQLCDQEQTFTRGALRDATSSIC